MYRSRDRPVRVIVVSVFATVALASAVAADPGPAAVSPAMVESIQIGGVAGVPADAVAVVLNVTVTGPGEAGFVAVTPCTPGAPTTSNLNYRADQDVAGTVLARLSDDGRICVSTSAATDVVVDVSGYLPAGSSLVPLSAPVRGLDTRSGLGVANAGQRPARSTTIFDVDAVSGAPSEVGTAVLNVTATGASEAGFVTVAPCGVTMSATSTLNVVPGRDIANLAVTAVASNGTVCVTTTVATHLIVDVFATAPASAVDPVMLPTPVRAVDSRDGTGTTATPFGPTEREVHLGHVPGLPVGASTAFVNVTATRASAAGFVSLHDCGAAPDNSNVNFVAGIDVANAAIVSLDSGAACVTASTNVDVVVDVLGASSSAATIVTFDPVRVHDTRSLAVPQCNVALSQPVGDRFTLTNLADFTTRVVRSPAIAAATSSGTFVTADITPECDAIVVGYGSSTQSAMANVVRIALDGTSSPVGSPGAHRTDAVLAVGDSGQVVSIRDDGAVDVVTGQMLLTLPATPSGFYRPLGLATETSYAYFHSFAGGRRQVEIYPAGVSPAPVEVIPLPDDIEDPPPFRFDDDATGFDGVRSPSGRYRLIGNPATYVTTIANIPTFLAAARPTVTGPNGVPEVSRSPVPSGPAYWLAEGLVVFCETPTGTVYRWQVLDDPEVIPVTTCPIAVR